MKLTEKAYANVALLKEWIAASEQNFVMKFWLAPEDGGILQPELFTKRLPSQQGLKHCQTMGCIGGHIQIMLGLPPCGLSVGMFFKLLDLPDFLGDEGFVELPEWAEPVYEVGSALFHVEADDDEALGTLIWPGVPEGINWCTFDRAYPIPADRIRLACQAIDNAVRYVEGLPEIPAAEVTA